MKNIRTDLAMEAHAAFLKESPDVEKIDGIDYEETEFDVFCVTKMHVKNKEAGDKINKKAGKYITIEAPGLKNHADDIFSHVTTVLSHELKSLLELKDSDKVLVVGLGNWNVTPDALGPKVIDSILVTRHLLEERPDDFARHFRSVCAVSPGVLGITGIQTFDILKGLISTLKPDALIVIDALASQSLKRLATTFQISDTGISPGSGVNTRYSTIDKETIGVKVISIGVPTVVDAATLAADVMDISNKGRDKPDYKELASALLPYDANLLVTPNNIDILISDTAKIIAFGINKALHNNLSDEDINSLIS